MPTRRKRATTKKVTPQEAKKHVKGRKILQEQLFSTGHQISILPNRWKTQDYWG
ncbi:uncharacterized protein G2W53_007962 [Senna tora]|uniref:Uncharacterized protein n=1 Tax=Senna tora TaxID=362788 RepID=A0A834X7M6_9FABA|nr:uncharacterized protein G2W53_007962 [Senna tora]